MKPKTECPLFYAEFQGEIHSFTSREAQNAWCWKIAQARTFIETVDGWRFTPNALYLGGFHPNVKRAVAYGRVVHHK